MEPEGARRAGATRSRARKRADRGARTTRAGEGARGRGWGRRGSANARSASSAPWTCSPPLCARSHPWRRERTEHGRARRRVRSRGEIFHALTSARVSAAPAARTTCRAGIFSDGATGRFPRSRLGPPSNDPNAERARVDLCDGVISERVGIELRRVRRLLAPQRRPSPRPMDAASVDSRFPVKPPASRFLASSRRKGEGGGVRHR